MKMTSAEYYAYVARGRKAFEPAGPPDEGPESKLHDRIWDECRRRGWVVLHGSMASRTHRTAGEPDFVIVREGGVLFVECKSAAGKLTPEQAAMGYHLAKLGHQLHVVRSFKAFLEIL